MHTQIMKNKLWMDKWQLYKSSKFGPQIKTYTHSDTDSDSQMIHIHIPLTSALSFYFYNKLWMTTHRDDFTYAHTQNSLYIINPSYGNIAGVSLMTNKF